MVSGRLAAAREPGGGTLAARGGPAGDGGPPQEAQPGRGARTRGRPEVVSRGEDTERAFLALCIAEPESGARALGELDLYEHFTSDLLRRAAGHLRGHLADPGARTCPRTIPSSRVCWPSSWWRRAASRPAPAMLAVQRMQLELARIDREIQRARAQEAGDVSELAQRRAEVKREFDLAYERALEETG